MNKNQRKVLLGVGTIVLAMLIFPPYRSGSRNEIVNGYDFLFALPYEARLDATTLLVQWVGVLIVGAIAFFLLKDK